MLHVDVTEAGVKDENSAFDGAPTATGHITVTDVEGDSLTYTFTDESVTQQGKYGSLTLHDDGSYTYTLDNADADTDSLSASQQATESFTIRVSDGQGGFAEQDVNVNITGTNDQPIIAIDAQDNTVTEDSGDVTASGLISVADVDADGDSLAEQTLSVTNEYGGQSAESAGGNVSYEGEYGNIVIDGQTGEYTYTLGVTDEQKARVDLLTNGENPKEQFTIRTTDAHGAYTEQSVDVLVRGKNDNPDIESADTWLSVTEAGLILGGNVPTDGDPTDGGRITASDAEGQDISFHLAGADDNVRHSEYGTFTLNDDGSYTYTLNNEHPDVQALNPGEVTQEQFTVNVQDSAGGVTKQVIRVNISGTNDAPTIGITPHDNHVMENSPDRRASGQIAIADKDSDDDFLTEQTLSIAFDKEGESGNASAEHAGGDVVLEGLYGTITLDGVSGAYIYTLVATPEQAARVEALKSDTYTEDFTIRTTDAHGAYSEEILSINITGKNDAPDIHAESSVLSVHVTEEGVQENEGDPNAAFAGTPTAAGVIVASDVEGSDVTFSLVGGTADNAESSSLTGVYGTLTLNADGTYSYALDNTDVHTQLLEAGAQSQDIFRVQVSDGEGGVTVQSIVVHVGGTNDKPELAAISNDSDVRENSIDMLASGVLVATDADGAVIADQVISVDGVSAAAAGENVTIEGEYGNITFYGDTGAYLYTMGVTEEQQKKAAALDNGESAMESFDVRVTDEHGAFADTGVNITVHGNGRGGQCDVRREAVVIDLEATEAGVRDDGHTQDEGVPLTQGYILPANAHSKVQSLRLETDTGDSMTHKGEYGTLTLNPNGTYIYILDNADTDSAALSRGEQAMETFSIKVQYKDGSVGTEDVRVTVTGTNDKPILTVTSPPALLTEDDIESGMDTSLSGQIDVHDADADADIATSLFRINNSEAAAAGEDVSFEGIYGTLIINGSTGEYTYTAGATAQQSARLNSLAEGQEATEDFVIRTTDSHGAFGETPLPVTVQGSNDAPVINASSSVLELAVRESGLEGAGLPVTQGFVIASDVDGDSLRFSVQGSDAEGEQAQENNGEQLARGTYGTLTLYADGSYVYTLDNTDAETEGIASGEQVQDLFTVTVHDAHGGTHEQTLTVTVTGNNDGPVVNSEMSTLSLELVEDGVLDGEFFAGTPFAEGRVIVSDVDGDALSYTLVGGSNNMQDGRFGTLILNDDGSYSYTLNNEASATAALRQDEVQEEVFLVTVDDGKGGFVQTALNVRVVGTNDVPQIHVEQGSGSLTENADVQSLSGSISIDDADADGGKQSITVNDMEAQEDGSITVMGVYGTLVLLADGDYTYTLGTTLEQQSRLDALDEGQSHVESFAVRTTDAHGATAEGDIAITIHGAVNTGTGEAMGETRGDEPLLALDLTEDTASVITEAHMPSLPVMARDASMGETVEGIDQEVMSADEALAHIAASPSAEMEGQAAVLHSLDNSGSLEGEADISGTHITSEEAQDLENMEAKDILVDVKEGMNEVLEGVAAERQDEDAWAFAEDAFESSAWSLEEDDENLDFLWDEDAGAGIVDMGEQQHHEDDAAVLAAKVQLEVLG